MLAILIHLLFGAPAVRRGSPDPADPGPAPVRPARTAPQAQIPFFNCQRPARFSLARTNARSRRGTA